MVYIVKYNQSSIPQVGDTLVVDSVDSDNNKGEMSWNRIPVEFSIADDQGDSDVVNLPETLTFIGGTGLTSNIGDNTVTYDIDSTGVSSGTYGSSTEVPILTINEQGQVTSATNQTIEGIGGFISVADLQTALQSDSGSYDDFKAYILAL